MLPTTVFLAMVLAAPPAVILNGGPAVVYSDGSYEIVHGQTRLRSVGPHMPTDPFRCCWTLHLTTLHIPTLPQATPKLFRGSNWSDLTMVGSAGGPVNGSDALGTYERVVFRWALASSTPKAVVWETAILVYPATNIGTGLLHGLVVFEQTFSAGIVSTGEVGADHPQSMWPAFAAADVADVGSSPALGFLSFRGCMSGDATVGRFGSSVTDTIPKLGGEVSNLRVEACRAGLKNQSWGLLKGGMVENAGNGMCLQLGRCLETDDAKVAADVPCKLSSMCGGRNLQWKYVASNKSFVSQLSAKCLTVTPDGRVGQSDCDGAPTQKFAFDAATGHIGPSVTVCLTVMESPAPPPPPGPPAPPPPTSADWGGVQGGPMAIFVRASARALIALTRPPQ